MYTCKLLDKDLGFLRAVAPASCSYDKRINNAGTSSVAVAYTTDHDDTDSIIVLREDQQVFSGQVVDRDRSGNEHQYTLAGHEILLDRYRTPRRWEAWNGQDLADVVKDHCKVFGFERLTTLADLSGAALVASSQVDIWNWDGGDVSIDRYAYSGGERYYASGYVRYRFDLGADALSTGRLIRWTETIGEKVRITIKSRSADIEGNLAGEGWTAETTAVHVGDVANNEVSGVTIPAGVSGHRWIEVEITLYTDDTLTQWDDAGTDVYGYTPMLHGFEIIWREAGPVAEGTIPGATGVIVEGFEFNRQTMLKSLVEICDFYEWEFRVAYDATSGTIKLNLGQGGAAEIGTDRTADSGDPSIIAHRDNSTIAPLKDSLTQVKNRIHCWGAGSGADQLYVVVEDAVSIAAYGLREDDFEDTEIDDIAVLTAAGNAKLAELKDPASEFQAQTTLTEPALGDTVTVTHPDSLVLIDARVKEERRQWGTGGETITLGLESLIYNPLEAVMGKPKSLRAYRATPPTPTQVLATGYYETIIVTWKEPGDSYAVRYMESGGADWHYAATEEREFIHDGLDVGDTWDYQVASIKDGRLSAWSATVSATVSTIASGDVDTTAPAAPTWAGTPLATDVIGNAQNQLQHRITLDWVENGEADLKEYRIYRSSDGGANYYHIATTAKGTTIYVDASDLIANTTYYYKLTAVDTFLNESALNAAQNITTGANPTPANPTDTPTQIPGYKLMGVTFTGLVGAEIGKVKHYVVEYSTCAADLDTDTNTYSMPGAPVWGGWATAGTTDSLIYVHSGLDWDKGYRYRYYAVNISGNSSGYSAASAGAVCVKSGGADVAYHSVLADHMIATELYAIIIKAASDKVRVDPTNGIVATSYAQSGAPGVGDLKLIIDDDELWFQYYTGAAWSSRIYMRATSAAGRITCFDSGGGIALYAMEDYTQMVKAYPVYGHKLGVGNYFHGTATATADNIFDWFSPFVANAGDLVAVRGGYQPVGVGQATRIVSVLERVDADTVRFRSIDTNGTALAEDYDNGDSTNEWDDWSISV